MSLVRAFVAVDATSNEISNLQKEMISGLSAKDIKPVNPDNFHFTLIFLGEVGEQGVASVVEKLGEIRFEPFSITYTGVGAFPSPGNVRVMWVGIDEEGATRLAALARKVLAKMSEVGFRPDKPFSPHLTIFRAKNRHVRVNVSKYSGKTFGATQVDRVHLKKSDLSPAGPTYSNVYTVNAAKEQA